MATEIEPLIMPFDPLWVTTSKREYREAVRRMGEEPGDTKGKDGLTSCIPGKGCVVWISRKVKAPDLYALAAHEATHAACDMLASIGEDTPARRGAGLHGAVHHGGNHHRLRGPQRWLTPRCCGKRNCCA